MTWACQSELASDLTSKRLLQGGATYWAAPTRPHMAFPGNVEIEVLTFLWWVPIRSTWQPSLFIPVVPLGGQEGRAVLHPSPPSPTPIPQGTFDNIWKHFWLSQLWEWGVGGRAAILSKRIEVRMLLNILQRTGKPPQQSIFCPKISVSAEAENPALTTQLH